LREADPVFGEGVDVRCGDFAAVATHVRISKVVCEDQQYVGLLATSPDGTLGFIL
jgi:hypothetical protein